jgi:GntR family transcriptional regulator
MTSLPLSDSMKPNANSALPLYAQLEQILADRISDGSWRPGDQLPTEDQLVSEFEISRTTVRTTVQNLARRGLIEIRRGKGTFVAQPKIEPPLTGLSSFVEDMCALGHSASARLLGHRSMPASKIVAQKLNLPVGDPVIYVRRVRLANGIALSYDETWLPRELGEQVVSNNLEAEPIFKLLEEKYDTPLIEAEYRLEAVVADRIVAQTLDIAIASPIFLIERVSFTKDDRPVDYEKLHYRGDQVQFITRLSRQRGDRFRLDQISTATAESDQ